MVEIEEADREATIAAARLRLRFSWNGDRWAHALEVGPEPGGSLLARSVDIPAERIDSKRVVSPAFQQLQLQRGAFGAQALLVGQSGPHHFSAVFHVRQWEASVLVEVDIADRCRAEIAGLASTYRVEVPAADWIEADPSRLIWRPGGSPQPLEFSAWGPPAHRARITCAEAGRGAWHVQAEAPLDPRASTHRWSYRWCWGLPAPL
ncbi:MAG: hypothetical protein IRY99_06390 [Isosphaeraceae bacterium]|nr:hypothetical protein [Isosphaeraceae bacterium]